MAILHKNITASGDIHNPKWHPDANNGDYAWKNEKGELESIDELLLPAALNFVDGSVAPPTSNTNDIYILSSGASVNAGWGTVALQDWVKYDGAVWNVITPQKSSLCYDKTADSLMGFNGTAWAAIGGGGVDPNAVHVNAQSEISGITAKPTPTTSDLLIIEDAADSNNKKKITIGDLPSGGDSIYSASGTVPGSTVATITDSLTFASGKVILSSVTDGILLNRLTDLEMASLIATAQDNEVIFNTDKHALYRFDTALNNWVALAAGFGIVGTTDSTGKPTFYATVKAAYEAAQGSIKLYSDITESVSRTINIVNGRDIDLNGFTYTYSATDGSNMFDDANGPFTVRIINGRLLRTGGTAASHALKFDFVQNQIDVVNCFVENSNGISIVNAANLFNATGSTFISNLSSGNGIVIGKQSSLTSTIIGGNFFVKGGANLNCVAKKLQNTVFNINGAGRTFFKGTAVNCQFYSENNTAVNIASSIGGVRNNLINCFAESISGKAVNMNGADATNSTFITGNNSAAIGGNVSCNLFNCYLENNSNSFSTISNITNIDKCTVIQSGTTYNFLRGSIIDMRITNCLIKAKGNSTRVIYFATDNTKELSVINNTFFVENNQTIIRTINADVEICKNTVKGSTNFTDLGTGSNTWTATTDAQGNILQA